MGAAHLLEFGELRISGRLYIPLRDAAVLVGCATDPELVEDLYRTKPIALVESVAPGETGVVKIEGRRWVPYDDLDQLRFWAQWWADRPRRPRRKRRK